ncbi:hypothetical protein [Sphingobium yanoikuyae]|uniref:hypothetical protein n=1 Tax=Sphingobium yanoikuyae TaxID=13690 RepID=UPI0028A63206|nr:hypothetical protein [Sphingobium yanoikuyae]
MTLEIAMTGRGTGEGAQIIQDGIAQPLAVNVLSRFEDADLRVKIGDYSAGGVYPLRAKLGGLAIFPVYVGGGENADLLADINAEFGAYQISLNS